MADITIASMGPLSYYGEVILKPDGLAPSTRYRFVCLVTWFYSPGVPSIAGWDLVDYIDDASVVDSTSTAMFMKDVTDASSEPASYTFSATGGADWRGQIIALAGDIDLVTPIGAGGKAKQASSTSATVAPGPLSAARPGSMLVMAGGCWYFTAWQALGSGGGQVYPTGWTPTLGNTNDTELGGFYLANVPAGPVDTTFGGPLDRFAAIAAVIQPPGETAPEEPPPLIPEDMVLGVDF